MRSRGRARGGRAPGRTDLHGVLVLAKPRGPSSNQALQEVRRLLGGVKAGHAGTLDPEAEGVLPVLLGEGAKLAPFLAGLEKEYEGVARFGAETDTQDGAGEVVREAPFSHLDAGGLQEAMAAFLGAGLQEPPMHSAVKVGGERLYRLAREGREVERAPRPILVAEFSLLAWEPPDARFRVRCSGGTYVRTLCRDLGRRLASAAHMAALTRTAVGHLRLADATTVGQLASLPRGASPPGLIGLADALRHLPALRIGDETAQRTRQGRGLLPRETDPPADLPEGALARLVDVRGGLVAVVRAAGPAAPLVIERVFTPVGS